MNKQKPMALPLNGLPVQSAASRIRKASRLLRPSAPRVQARWEKPRVFCDPRMPGGWHALDELLSGNDRAA